MTARRLKRYPAYQDSGVEWLGDVPTHWKESKVKFLGRYINGYAFKPDDWNVDGRPIIRIQNLTNPDAPFNRFSGELDPRYRVTRGDILISWSASLGLFIWSETEDGWLNQHIFKAVLRDGFVDRSYFVWLGDWFIRELQKETHGSTMTHLTYGLFGGFRVDLPSAEEQRAIAAFLDRETARIDALVTKKERLIEVLQEQRTALITRAVTKGLDPNVPMKDSGVEWLDQYPAHWTGLPLKRWVATKITDGPHETPELVTEGVDFISAEAVQDGSIDFDKRRGFISPDLHANFCRKCRPVRDDILICKSGATTGKLARVDVDVEFSVWSPLALVRANRSRVLPGFLELALGSEYVQKQIKQTWSAGTQPNISMGDLEQLFVVAPQVEEQAKILAHVEQQSGGFRPLGARVHDAIDRLKELRTALISAAVTGKIDVREEVA